mgnify:CR=1 FL=1
MIMTEKERSEMLEAARPLIKWMNEHCHPHLKAVVDNTTIELLEGIATGRTQDELDQYLSTEPDPVPNTEPPIAQGQGEWERWFAHFSPRNDSSETVERIRILRAEHHAEAWRKIADEMDGYATIVCAWRKVAQKLSK